MPMHATHEELELKEHVASTLARQGVLGKIKVHLTECMCGNALPMLQLC